MLKVNNVGAAKLQNRKKAEFMTQCSHLDDVAKTNAPPFKGDFRMLF